MIEAVICFASGLAGGFALACVSRRPVAPVAPIANVIEAHSVPTVSGLTATPRRWSPENTAPKPGGPTYRIVSDAGALLTETTDPVSAVQSWRVLKNSPRTERWQFRQDDAVRDQLGITH